MLLEMSRFVLALSFERSAIMKSCLITIKNIVVENIAYIKQPAHMLQLAHDWQQDAKQMHYPGDYS